MSNTPQNDDLITEVLNQDPKYVDTRNQKEGDFKGKIKPKKSWFILKKSTWKNPLFFAPVAASVLIVTLVGVVAFRNSQINSTSSQNVSKNNTSSLISDQDLSSSKIANSPSPFLPVPNGTQESDQSKLENPLQGNSTLDKDAGLNSSSSVSGSATVNSDGSKKDETYMFKIQKQVPQNTVNKGNPAAVSVQTEVKSQDGSLINFNYDPNRNLISYDGKIVAPDPCTVLDGYNLEKQNTSFTLKYKLKRVGDICAQMVVEIPVSGSLNIELNQVQADGFDKLFRIEKTFLFTKKAFGSKLIG